MWYPRALADGIIAPFDIALVGVGFSSAERAHYEQLTDNIGVDARSIRNYLDEQGISTTPDFMKAVVALAEGPEGTASQAVAKRYLKTIADRQRLLAETPAKFQALQDLTTVVRASGRTLVFGHSQDAAQAASFVFENAGIRAACVMSGMNRLDRLEALNGFRYGRIHVLAAPRVLDEGVDVPEADLAIVTSGTRRERQMIQRLGRVIRRKAHGGPGRLAYLFVQGTIEDPALREEFLPRVLPFARRQATFDIATQLAELKTFLTALEIPTEIIQKPQIADGGQFAVGQNGGTGAQDFVLDEGNTDAPPAQLPSIALEVDPVRHYFKKISQHRLLDEAREVELAIQIEAGLYAEHRLANFPPAQRREVQELRVIAREGNGMTP